MEEKEIEITVPWGIVAAKTWGNEANPLVLALHGWSDNANSFVPLIPLLHDFYYYIAIDLPGNGRSSHLGPMLIFHHTDYVLALKILFEYFKRDKIILLAHSASGCVATQFAQIYPQCVSKLIVLDVFYYLPRFIVKEMKNYRHLLDAHCRFMLKKSIAPTYTWEEAIDKFMVSRMTPISRKCTELLASRNLELVGNGRYKIRTCQYSKLMEMKMLTHSDITDIAKHFPIKCPHLIILTTNSQHIRFASKDLINEYKKNPQYEFYFVEGNHDVHLEKPNRVAPIINKFLAKQSNKL